MLTNDVSADEPKPAAARAAPDRGAGALLQRGSRRSPRWSAISAPRCRGAAIYVYDNNSTDRTVDVARARRRRGAPRDRTRAKATWCGACSPTWRPTSTCWSTATRPTTRRARAAMIARLIEERLDMVVRARGSIARRRPTGRGHRTGNRLLTGFVPHMFGQSFSDMLSGYRVFSRRFVKSFPVLSGGFEIETELTIHALELELPVAEMRHALLRAAARARPPSSTPGATASASCGPSSSSTAPSGRCRSSPHRRRARPSSRSGSRSRSSSPSCRKASCRACRPRSWRPA